MTFWTIGSASSFLLSLMRSAALLRSFWSPEDILSSGSLRVAFGYFAAPFLSEESFFLSLSLSFGVAWMLPPPICA